MFLRMLGIYVPGFEMIHPFVVNVPLFSSRHARLDNSVTKSSSTRFGSLLQGSKPRPSDYKCEATAVEPYNSSFSN